MFDIVASRATFAQSLQNMRQKPFCLESIVIIAIIIILACFCETKAHFAMPAVEMLKNFENSRSLPFQSLFHLTKLKQDGAGFFLEFICFGVCFQKNYVEYHIWAKIVFQQMILTVYSFVHYNFCRNKILSQIDFLNVSFSFQVVINF